MDFPRICPVRWLSYENHDIFNPFYDIRSNYFRPWKWYNQSISKEFGSTVENEKGNYKITLDVINFRPNDINVKVTENEIIVEGQHEERPDTHGFISRQFKRRYALPRHCSADNVTSSMSSDGILTIIAEKRASNETEKIIPIKMCGTYPTLTQVESKMNSEITQKTVKENMKDTEEVSCNKNKAQIMSKEDHSRLLKPELFKDIKLDTNGDSSTKQVTDIMGMTEKKATMGTTSNNKIEESLAKSSIGLSDELEKKYIASTSEISGTKGMSMSNISKTLIEESSSTYKSSSSMSSTMKTSGKIGDIISAELKEAAENV